MQWLEVKILQILRTNSIGLTTREICCALNNKPRDYCLNVDGEGSRCRWWYRRPRHESQKIRLGSPLHMFLYVVIGSSPCLGALSGFILHCPESPLTLAAGLLGEFSRENLNIFAYTDIFLHIQRKMACIGQSLWNI